MSKSRLFLLFALLQVCDLLTTLLFLHRGIGEGNPLMRAALNAAPQPLIALAVPKVGAIGLAWYAARSGRMRLLSRINLFFTCCVAWNLVALAAA